MSESVFVLGVTGGIGSGKSEVLKYFSSLPGAAVCRADDVGMQLQKKGGKAYEPIVNAFGREILKDDGELDRQKIGDIVFRDPDSLAVLNSIVHPLVEDQIRQEVRCSVEMGKDVFVVESAILLDVGYREFCDEVWYVRAPLETRIGRIVQTRHMSGERAAAVIERQMTDEQFCEKCDFIIDNSGDLEDMYAQIRDRLCFLHLCGLTDTDERK